MPRPRVSARRKTPCNWNRNGSGECAVNRRNPADLGHRRHSGRTSSATVRANQLQLCFPVFAGVLMNILRRAGLRLAGPAMARINTIRSRLLKLAGRIRVNVRQVWQLFASVFPPQHAFAKALAGLEAALAAMRAPPP